MLQQKRKGFTLIELLIVVVIIGILAAIAIPKFASTKEKAYISAMKSDLRNMATSQEGYFADNMVYVAGTGSNLSGTVTAHPTGFTPSAGVSITTTVGSPAGRGWSATATHTGTDEVCTIAYGSTVAAGDAEGEPDCSVPAAGT